MLIDELDRAILRIIQRNPRIKTSEIARRLGKPRSTIVQRINKLESEGVIREYRAILDPSKIGYKYSALIMVKIRKGLKSFLTQNELAEKLIRETLRNRNMPFIEEVFIITGSYDMVLKVWIREWKELTAFLLSYLPGMEEVESTETLMVLEKRPKTSAPFPI